MDVEKLMMRGTRRWSNKSKTPLLTLIVSVQALRDLLLVEGHHQARERELPVVDSSQEVKELDPDLHPDHRGHRLSSVECLALPA